MSQDIIQVNQLNFKPYLGETQIKERISEMAAEIKAHYKDKEPIFLVLLNGAFVFASDLLRAWDKPVETRFIKVSSYEDMESTGKIDFNRDAINDLSGKDILIIEDIIDTGHTLHDFTQYLRSMGVASIAIASLLLKPSKLKHDINADFLGFSISDLFVIGYGLDYNERARNLKAIYILDEAAD
ncbi:MAG: hypoxanthine phosphoribosyltransferase [Saprospiraceae bacterium]|jgi:hypoxanthine phosphoribosyltransferase|nr:hypoxanthine phosphoribosyltransferase [Saprospiraceae bacterium]MBP9194889.1 hypoxanthine phosphoribosyltransferase [Saprospiraceae bacterium]